MNEQIRPDVHARFRALVERAIVKADQAHAAHRARIRASQRIATLREPRGRAVGRKGHSPTRGA